MFCQSCGKEIPEGASFCGECGAPVGAKAESAVATAVAQAAQKPKRKMNIIGLIAGIAVALSTFMPLYSVNVFGTKVTSSATQDSTITIIFLVIAALGIVFSLFGTNVLVSIMGVVTFGWFLLIQYSFESTLEDDALGELAKSMIQKDIGFYLLLLGAIGLLIGGIVGIINKKKNK